jgi:hypothetical protein
MELFGVVADFWLRCCPPIPHRELWCRHGQRHASAHGRLRALGWNERRGHPLQWCQAGNERVLHTRKRILLRRPRGDDWKRSSHRYLQLQLGREPVERVEQHLFGRRDSDAHAQLPQVRWRDRRRCELRSGTEALCFPVCQRFLRLHLLVVRGWVWGL